MLLISCRSKFALVLRLTGNKRKQWDRGGACQSLDGKWFFSRRPHNSEHLSAEISLHDSKLISIRRRLFLRAIRNTKLETKRSSWSHSLTNFWISETQLWLSKKYQKTTMWTSEETEFHSCSQLKTTSVESTFRGRRNDFPSLSPYFLLWLRIPVGKVTD